MTNKRTPSQIAQLDAGRAKAHRMYRARMEPLRAKIRGLLSAGLSPTAIARDLGCSRMTVYKVKKSEMRDA